MIGESTDRQKGIGMVVVAGWEWGKREECRGEGRGWEEYIVGERMTVLYASYTLYMYR